MKFVFFWLNEQFNRFHSQISSSFFSNTLILFVFVNIVTSQIFSIKIFCGAQTKFLLDDQGRFEIIDGFGQEQILHTFELVPSLEKNRGKRQK